MRSLRPVRRVRRMRMDRIEATQQTRGGELLLSGTRTVDHVDAPEAVSSLTARQGCRRSYRAHAQRRAAMSTAISKARGRA